MSVYDFFYNYLDSVLDYYCRNVSKADEEWLDELLNEYIDFDEDGALIEELSPRKKEYIKRMIDQHYDWL